jgi:aarF domain-containing kinase
MVKFFKPTTKSMMANLLPSFFGEPARESAGAPSDIEIVHHLRSLHHDGPAFLAALEDLHHQGYQPELVFIDAGLVTRLEGQNRQNFLELFGAITRFDGYEAGRLMVERCRAPELVIDEEEFALRMQHLVLSVKSQTFSLAKIRIADVLSEVLNNVRRHHVKMEADFVNTVISILLLEGIGRQLDPNMDLFKSAVPILRQLGRQLGTDKVLKQAGGMDAQSLGTMLKVSRRRLELSGARASEY